MFKLFRNLKEDAIPRPPRSMNSEKVPTNEEPVNSTQEPASATHAPKPEEIFMDPNIEFEESTKPFKKNRNTFGNGSNGTNSSFSCEQQGNGAITINANTQGHNITVINGSHIQFGNTIYMGTTTLFNQGPHPASNPGDSLSKHVKRVMEAEIKPDHKYLYLVANNVENWCKFVENLGFSKEQIDEKLFVYRSYPRKEACYKLLLDWVDRSSDNNLGRLATFLYNTGERKVVGKLADLYAKEMDI